MQKTGQKKYFGSKEILTNFLFSMSASFLWQVTQCSVQSSVERGVYESRKWTDGKISCSQAVRELTPLHHQLTLVTRNR